MKFRQASAQTGAAASNVKAGSGEGLGRPAQPAVVRAVARWRAAAGEQYTEQGRDWHRRGGEHGAVTSGAWAARAAAEAVTGYIARWNRRRRAGRRYLRIDYDVCGRDRPMCGWRLRLRLGLLNRGRLLVLVPRMGRGCRRRERKRGQQSRRSQDSCDLQLQRHGLKLTQGARIGADVLPIG